jgi:hypothetical protein
MAGLFTLKQERDEGRMEGRKEGGKEGRKEGRKWRGMSVERIM